MTDQFTQWPFTKRAVRACLQCRSRKIRCNVEEHGRPCSNCLTDEYDCQMAESMRGRKPRRHVKPNPKGLKKRSYETQAIGPIKSNVDGSGTNASLSQVPPIHVTGWLDDNAEMNLFGQFYDEGMCIYCSLQCCL